MEVYPFANHFASPFHVGRYPRRTRAMDPEQHTVDREAETAESLDEVSTVPRDEQTAARPHLLTLYYPPDTLPAFIDKFPKQRVRKATNQTLCMGRGEGVDVLLNDIHMPRSFIELSCRVQTEEGPKWCVKNKSNKKPIRIVFNGAKTSLKHGEEKELQDDCEMKLETLRFVVKTEEGDVGELTEFELEILPMENDSTSPGSSFRSMNRQTSSSGDSAHSLSSATALNRQRAGSGRGASQNGVGVAQAANHFGLPLHMHGALPGGQAVQQLTQPPGNVSSIPGSQASTCCHSQYTSQHLSCQQCLHSPNVYHPVAHHLPQPQCYCGHQHSQQVNSPLAVHISHAPLHAMNSHTPSFQGSQPGGYFTHAPAHAMNDPAFNPQGSHPSQSQAPMTNYSSPNPGHIAPASGPAHHYFHGGGRGGGAASLTGGSTSMPHPQVLQPGVPNTLNQQLTNPGQVAHAPQAPYQQAASQGQIPGATQVFNPQGFSSYSQPGAPPQFSNQHFTGLSQGTNQQLSPQLSLPPRAQQTSEGNVLMSGAPYAMPELQGTSLQPHSSRLGYPGLSAHSQHPWPQYLQQQQYRDQGIADSGDQPFSLRGPQSMPGFVIAGQTKHQRPPSYTEGQTHQPPAYITQPESAAMSNLEMQQERPEQQRPTPIISNPTMSDRNPQLYRAYNGDLPTAPPTTQLDNLRLGYPVQVTVSDSTGVSSTPQGYPVQVTLPCPTEVTTSTPSNSLSHSGSAGWNSGTGVVSSGGEIHSVVNAANIAGQSPSYSHQPGSPLQPGGYAGAGSVVHPPAAALSSLTNPAANGNTIHLRNHEAIAATPPSSSDFSTLGSMQLQDLQRINRVHLQGQQEGQDQGREPQENDERQPQEHDDQQN
ncbi:uncharacterized protein [Littorina saxatilis]|uniref:Uncharacterized protein n=1 Tax=Littorina saxatilis TaxID=31220 RepID=A0AAN9GQQ4_9CAEN